MSSTRFGAILASALAFVGVDVARAVPFTIVDANFARTQLDVQRIDGTRLVGRNAQRQVEMQLRDIVLLDCARPTVPPEDTGRFQLVLRNGERLTGRATAFTDDTVTWTSASLADRKVPLTQIDRVVRAGARDTTTLSAEEATRDVLLLSNGDRASGIVSSMDEKALTLQGADGQPVSVEWTDVRELRLAASAEVTMSKANWRVSMYDGSVVDVDSIELNQDSVSIRRESQVNSVPTEQLRNIEHLSGRARLLVRVPPRQREYAPYFPRVGNENTIEVPEEVAVGDSKTRLFIAARPYSRMTWTLEGNFRRFKTRYAVAPTGPMANCQIRIWLDDKKVLDRAELASDASLGTFETPLGDARTLTLEVDFGENFDVQDQLYWIEPALLSD